MMINNRFVLLVLAVLIFVISGLSGCASPPKKEAMISPSIPGIQKHKHTVAISTLGGHEIGAIDGPSIGNENFLEAIKTSIIENGLFTKVIKGSESDYILNVTIVNMSKPMFGASMTASMEAAWSLQNTRNKNVVMRKSIRSSYTAGAFSAFAGTTRVRYAIEGAARENIRLGLMALSKLQLE